MRRAYFQTPVANPQVSGTMSFSGIRGFIGSTLSMSGVRSLPPSTPPPCRHSTSENPLFWLTAVRPRTTFLISFSRVGRGNSVGLTSSTTWDFYFVSYGGAGPTSHKVHHRSRENPNFYCHGGAKFSFVPTGWGGAPLPLFFTKWVRPHFYFVSRRRGPSFHMIHHRQVLI